MPLSGTKRALSGGGSGSGKMNRRGARMSIQLNRGRSNLDPNYGPKAWETLERAIRVICARGDTMNLSFEELYRLGYNLVIYDFGDLLYNGLQNVIANHLEDVTKTIEASPRNTFLAEIQRQWNWFTISIAQVGDILMYMDQTYVKRRKMSVHDLSVSLFRDKVIRAPGVNGRLIDSLFDNIDRDRNGEQIDWHVLHAITRLLVDLGNDAQGRSVYIHYFEEPLLERTAEFYARESKIALTECTCSEYLKRMEQRIIDETDRANRYLDRRTERELRSVTEVELLCKDLEQILDMPNSGFRWMLQNDKYEDICRAFRLYVNFPVGENLLCSLLRQEIVERGMEIITDASLKKNTFGLIDSCLAVRQKYNTIISEAFYSIDAETQTKEVNKTFVSAVNGAFEQFLNSFEQMPEFLSLYVDKLLRRDFKSSTEEEIEVKLDRLIALFRHLHERDAFERFFKQHLAKRLLYGRSVSEDAERSFAIKLKEECGSFYTRKVESMFNDMKTSAESNAEFHAKHVGSKVLRNVDLSVLILTTGSWPIASIPPCILPPEINESLQLFVEHYNLSHAGRVLSWQTSMGTAEIKSHFHGSTHELVVSTYQMCVLMLFTSTNQLSYKEIVESLACAKYKILTKEPKGREVEESDVFVFNDDFTCRGYRIRVSTISSSKDAEEEKAEMRKRVEQDRNPQIEAAIVRIMKDRRTINHNRLIGEVSKQLSMRFLPNVADIKKRIESLIDREFLTRESDRTYRYVA